MAKRGKRTGGRGCRPAGLGVPLLALALLGGLFVLTRLGQGLTAGGGGGGAAGLLSGGRGHIGLVAGHWNHDSGAVCPDGLEEVSINRDVAERTATLLRRAGYAVDLLGEFDPALEGYSADAFLSIHTDSCLEGLSGFKVARLPQSEVPEEADRLVNDLYTYYGEVTGLLPHLDTITYDMREYHAFREISPQTPGAIIEIGFMGEDRYLLTRQPDLAARGIARALIAFLDPEAETPTPEPAG